MSRITISLSDELAASLKREARRLGIPVSELVRQTLQRKTTGKKRRLPFAAIGRSGQQHTARNAEQILTREWGRAGDR